MIGRHCYAVLFFALSAAGAGLPAPRILPGQTLHLDAGQVSPICVSLCLQNLSHLLDITHFWGAVARGARPVLGLGGATAEELYC